MKTFISPFRIGLKQNRAVLDAKGHEVVVFPKGCEYLALKFVELINNDLKVYNPGEIAQKYKVPVGTIGCPHCGSTVYGSIRSTCDMCDKEYFKKE
jgi:hypothetical protein